MIESLGVAVTDVDPIIRVENLVFEYPTKRALFDIDVTVRRGSITALVGPNGAGKTTLIRCMVALQEPFSGRVLLDGIDVHKHPREAHKRMGYLPDFYGLYEHLTVRQCLTYVAWIQGADPLKTGTLVEAAAERLNITDRLNEKSGALSRGLKQRLAIAQAVIHEPEFLILDEPASGLDPDARYQLSKLLVQLCDGGMTLVVSSHILAELEDYATDVIVIRDGKIVSAGALAGTSPNEARRLIITLTEPRDNLEAVLGGIDGVSALHIENRVARLRLSGGDAAQETLLRTLFDAGLPVLEFKVETERLRDTYMATLSGVEDGKG